MAVAVRESLREDMEAYGYEVVNALVTDLAPNKTVVDAMNQINAERRLRMAAEEKAEAQKILVIKAAEADAESKRLAGLGLAKRRSAIITGLMESVKEFCAGVEGTSPTEAMQLIMCNPVLGIRVPRNCFCTLGPKKYSLYEWTIHIFIGTQIINVLGCPALECPGCACAGMSGIINVLGCPALECPGCACAGMSGIINVLESRVQVQSAPRHAQGDRQRRQHHLRPVLPQRPQRAWQGSPTWSMNSACLVVGPARAVARKALGWPKICKLAHAFLR
jgi:hypothetical protein